MPLIRDPPPFTLGECLILLDSHGTSGVHNVATSFGALQKRRRILNPGRTVERDQKWCISQIHFFGVSCGVAPLHTFSAFQQSKVLGFSNLAICYLKMLFIFERHPFSSPSSQPHVHPMFVFSQAPASTMSMAAVNSSFCKRLWPSKSCGANEAKNGDENKFEQWKKPTV